MNVDDDIQCYYENVDEGVNGWFKGKIIKVNGRNRTYIVQYDTGHIEKNVTKERIRKINKTTEVLPSKRNRNSVERFSPPQSSTKSIKRKRYSLEEDANIMLEFASRANELEDLYDDAITILQLSSSSIAPPSTSSSSIAPADILNSDPAGDLKIGDVIICYYKDKNVDQWFNAKIIKVNDDGTYDVEYNEKSKKYEEKNVTKDRIRKIKKTTEKSDGKRKSLKRKSLKRKSVKRKSVKRKSKF